MAMMACVAGATPAHTSYPVNFANDAVITHASRTTSRVGVYGQTSGRQFVRLTQPTDKRLYTNLLTDGTQQITVLRGEPVVPIVEFNGSWMGAYVYIDWNNNGSYDSDELVSFLRHGTVNSLGETISDDVFSKSHNSSYPLVLPQFFVPESTTPGEYAMRIKVDWQNDDPAGSNEEGQEITKNGGSIVDFVLNVSNDEPFDIATRYDSAGYGLVWHDEFDTDVNGAPDPFWWGACPCYENVAWNKYYTTRNDLSKVENGVLTMKAMENDGADPTDTRRWLTGGRQTQSKFHFTHGRVEARMKIDWQAGTFPAFWMMPQSPNGGWPDCGEIDIIEAAASSEISYHTIHGKWNNNGGSIGGTRNIDYTQWHVIGLVWTSEHLIWEVDGAEVFRAERSNSRLKDTWAFDYDFYIILNQSVGNGGFASNPVSGKVYTTEVDWVRVYADKNEEVKHNLVRGITLKQPFNNSTKETYDFIREGEFCWTEAQLDARDAAHNLIWEVDDSETAAIAPNNSKIKCKITGKKPGVINVKVTPERACAGVEPAQLTFEIKSADTESIDIIEIGEDAVFDIFDINGQRICKDANIGQLTNLSTGTYIVVLPCGVRKIAIL